MNDVPEHDPERQILELPLALQAGLYIFMKPLLVAHGLSTAPIRTVCEQLGVARSNAYLVAERIPAALATVVRPVGRPSRPADEDLGDIAVRYEITGAVRAYLVEHPGAMIGGSERYRYSDAFRRLILRLRAPGEIGASLPLRGFAEATGVPVETLRDWQSGRRQARDQGGCAAEGDETADVEQPDEAEVPDDAVYPDGVIAQIVALWRQSPGITPRTLGEVVRTHYRITVAVAAIVEILGLSGDLKRSRPRKPKPDPEAIRDALERFFAGAQWVADGKKPLVISVGGHDYPFNWELATDNMTGAHVGFTVSDVEDGGALIAAVDEGIKTTGAAPTALLRDNLPANHSAEVLAALDERSIIGMPSTRFRPENKAMVEGAFGLFAQTMPPIRISANPTREQARQIALLVLTAYCCGRNHVPRAGLNGQSAADAYRGAIPTDDEKEAARTRLLEIKARIEAGRNRDIERIEPALRKLLENAFIELGLTDPERHFIPSIAKHGFDAVVDGIAIFRSKHERGQVFDFPERYLLGIVSNVARRNEHMDAFRYMIELRLEAEDEMLEPLRAEDRRLFDPHHLDAYLDVTLENALASDITIDRAYWRARFLDTLDRLPAPERDQVIDNAVPLVANSFRIPRDETAFLVAQLAKRRTPSALAA